MAEIEHCNDPFTIHFQREMSEEMYLRLTRAKHEIAKESWPSLGNLIIKLPSAKSDENGKSNLLLKENDNYIKIGTHPKRLSGMQLSQFYIKSQIRDNVTNAYSKYCGKVSLNNFHSELLSVICDYKDLYFTEEDTSNCKDLRFIYSLHAINHALKTRLKILHHNARLTDKTDVPDEFRDQGLVRPKVLILVPFRNSAFE